MANNKELVLIVEDDSETANLVKQFLPCFETVTAGSAREANQMLRSNLPIKACILDLNLPDVIPGYELKMLKFFATEYHNVAFLVMSGAEYSDTDIIHAGAQDFIPKPIENPRDIRRQLFRSLARHHVRHEFDPIESEIACLKERAVACGQNWSRAAHDSDNFLTSTNSTLEHQSRATLRATGNG